MEQEKQKYKQYVPFLTEHRDCIICGEKYSNIWIKCSHNSLVMCEKCGLVWADPHLNKDGIKLYYNGYLDNIYVIDKKSELRKKQYEIDRKSIELFLPKKKNIKIFDLGCSNGEFLKYFDNKFLKYGFDIDNAANNNNKNFFYGDLDKLPNNFKDFDVVILRGVMQHLDNPQQYFKKIQQIIKKNGILYVYITPNFNSFCAQVFKENWNLFDPIAYMFYFSDKTAEKFINKFGFKLIHKEFPYIDGPYCNIENDYKCVKNLLSGIAGISPPFWGNMMNLVFRKD